MHNPSGGPRSLARYLALPRPGDFGKAIVLPWGFGLAVIATGAPSAHAVARAVVVWFALEYLVYQARYQWNDIRGFAADQAHPESAQRRRLPRARSGATTSITASAFVAGVRLALVGVLVILLPGLDLAPVLLPSGAAVLLVAFGYEALRDRSAHHAPAHVLDAPTVGLWLAIGGGYCVRGLTGVVLGASSPAPVPALVLSGLAFWSGGILFVTARWAVESVPFAVREQGRLVWRAEPALGRGHLLPLSRWIRSDGGRLPADLRRWRPLWSQTVWHAPWNLAGATMAVFTLAASARLADGVGREAATVTVALASAAALYAVCLHQCSAEIGHTFRYLARTALPSRAPSSLHEQVSARPS